MAISIRVRAHEWFADRLPWVQYQQIRSLTARRQPLFAFKHQMPLWKRFVLVQLSIVLVLMGLAVTAVGLFVAIVLTRAVLGV